MTGRRHRVAESHHLTRIAFAIAGGFGLVAVVWAILVALHGGSWWGPVHAFLAGAVLAAISGATQMFTITWATAPAPSRWLTGLQRMLLAGGVLLVLAGVPTGRDGLTWTGGIMVISALALLAVSLVSTIRRSLLRRFDLSIRFYLLALACGLVGVTLGVLLGTGDAPAASYLAIRRTHVHLNLIGLVGFTIVGTLPTLLPTFARHRAVTGSEGRVAWWLAVVAAATMTAGIVAPAWMVGAGTLTAGLGAVLVTAGIVGRLGSRAIRGGLPYLHVVAGVSWLAAWTAVDGVALLAGTPAAPFGGWTMAAVVAGVGQVLLGSLAYLVPVVIGPPIAENLDRMGRSPWPPLIAANLTGMLLAAGWGSVAVATGAVWIGDFIRRSTMLRRPTREDARI